MSWIKMEKSGVTTITLRKFGLTMAAALFVITIFILLRHKHGAAQVALVAALFFLSSFISPAILKPVYISWMRLALIMSWINTRLILIIIFYLIFSPLGFIIRLFGKDLLDRRIDTGKSSYWKQKDKQAFEKLSYERQF